MSRKCKYCDRQIVSMLTKGTRLYYYHDAFEIDDNDRIRFFHFKCFNKLFGNNFFDKYLNVESMYSNDIECCDICKTMFNDKEHIGNHFEFETADGKKIVFMCQNCFEGIAEKEFVELIIKDGSLKQKKKAHKVKK